ncbi:Uncharacterised protein [Chlamydia trachomatis]|nr:Uncharacterised protein [Chlamydia trachomatis]
MKCHCDIVFVLLEFSIVCEDFLSGCGIDLPEVQLFLFFPIIF